MTTARRAAEVAWVGIEGAPRDGSVVVVGSMRPHQAFPMWPIEAKFINRKWHMRSNGRWVSFDPQPTHWNPDQ